MSRFHDSNQRARFWEGLGAHLPPALLCIQSAHKDGFQHTQEVLQYPTLGHWGSRAGGLAIAVLLTNSDDFGTPLKPR